MNAKNLKQVVIDYESQYGKSIELRRQYNQLLTGGKKRKSDAALLKKVRTRMRKKTSPKRKSKKSSRKKRSTPPKKSVGVQTGEKKIETYMKKHADKLEEIRSYLEMDNDGRWLRSARELNSSAYSWKQKIFIHAQRAFLDAKRKLGTSTRVLKSVTTNPLFLLAVSMILFPGVSEAVGLSAYLPAWANTFIASGYGTNLFHMFGYPYGSGEKAAAANSVPTVKQPPVIKTPDISFKNYGYRFNVGPKILM